MLKRDPLEVCVYLGPERGTLDVRGASQSNHMVRHGLQDQDKFLQLTCKPWVPQIDW
jgi:hypothetical protein